MEEKQDRTTRDLVTIGEVLAAGLSLSFPPALFVTLLFQKLGDGLRPVPPQVIGTFATALAQFRDQLDAEYMKSEGWQDKAREIVQALESAREQKKRAYYASAFVATARRARPPDSETYRMIDTLRRLRESHLQMLRAVMTNPDFEIGLGPIVDMSFDNGALTGLMDGTFEELVRDWNDLQREALVENEPILGSPRAGYRKFATEYAMRFEQFIRLPYADVHPVGDDGPAADH